MRTVRQMSTAFSSVAASFALLLSSPALKSQALGWSGVAESQPVTTVGGQTGRNGVSAAVFNGRMYLAYTSNTAADQYGNGQVYVESSTDGINFSNQVAVVPPAPQSPLLSYGNPSLTVWNGKLWLAANYNQGASNVGFLTSSADGVKWSAIGAGTSYNVIGSPSLAVLNNVLYAAYANNGNHTIVFCTITPNSSTIYSSNCLNWTNNQTNFNPSLGVYKGQLYVGYSDYSNDHNIWLLYAPAANIPNFTTTSVLSNDQSSAPPSFAVHNGVFYVGFRTNDGNQKFLYRASTDGVNFAADNDPSYTIAGYPNLVDTTGLYTSSFNGALIDYFASSLGSLALYSTHLQ